MIGSSTEAKAAATTDPARFSPVYSSRIGEALAAGTRLAGDFLTYDIAQIGKSPLRRNADQRTAPRVPIMLIPLQVRYCIASGGETDNDQNNDDI